MSGNTPKLTETVSALVLRQWDYCGDPLVQPVGTIPTKNPPTRTEHGLPNRRRTKYPWDQIQVMRTPPNRKHLLPTSPRQPIQQLRCELFAHAPQHVAGTASKRRTLRPLPCLHSAASRAQMTRIQIGSAFAMMSLFSKLSRYAVPYCDNKSQATAKATWHQQ
jgi:hypothetical protein